MRLRIFGVGSLLDYGARYYDARLSRFLSVDPLASDFPSWNPYHYVHNNPLRYTDPTGMSADDIIIDVTKDDEGSAARDRIFNALQALTDDKLGMDGNKVIILQKGEGDKTLGTSMIRSFVEGFEIDGEMKNRDVTFKNRSGNPDLDNQLGGQAFTFPKNSTAATNGTGTNAEIIISPFMKPSSVDADGVRRKKPFALAVGHELIHAKNAATGTRKSLAPIMMNGRPEISPEEAQTFGRENRLRIEQRNRSSRSPIYLRRVPY